MKFYISFNSKKDAEIFYCISALGVYRSLKNNVLSIRKAEELYFLPIVERFFKIKRFDDKIIDTITSSYVHLGTAYRHFYDIYLNIIKEMTEDISNVLTDKIDSLDYLKYDDSSSKIYKERVKIAKRLIGLLEDHVIAQKVNLSIDEVKKLRKKCNRKLYK